MPLMALELWNFLIPCLLFPCIVCLFVCFRVGNCGMNFQWSFFEFTCSDCQNVGIAIKATPSLEVFRLRESKVSNEQTRILVSHLLDHPGLRLLGKVWHQAWVACIITVFIVHPFLRKFMVNWSTCCTFRSAWTLMCLVVFANRFLSQLPRSQGWSCPG